MKKSNTDTTIFASFKSYREYLEMLEAAIENSEIGYLIADAEGKVIKVNKAQINITGQEPNYNMGRNMREVQIEDQSPSATVKVIETLKPVKLEQHLNNGHSYLVYSNPHFDKDGKLKFIISNLIDSTEINNTKKYLESIKTDNERLNIQIQELQSQIEPQKKIIFQSSVMQQVISLCDKVAQFDSNVLLQGESGVGKEKIAEYIFEKSSRNKRPFIKINCASIPENLLESELFGYEAGSFTGASSKGKKGILDYANEGILLLDEISELTLPLQAKLLRFLQDGEFYRVGGREPIKTNVRIIAASNKEFEVMISQGKFREDLYYRLNVIPIHIPPLRERKEDIPLLVGHFTRLFNEKHNLKKSWSIEAVNTFLDLPLKGNVRELQNTIERILVLIEHDIITENDVIDMINGIEIDSYTENDDSSLKEMLKNQERRILKQFIIKYKTEEQLSKVLKVSQSTISRKLALYNIKGNIQK